MLTLDTLIRQTPTDELIEALVDHDLEASAHNLTADEKHLVLKELTVRLHASASPQTDSPGALSLTATVAG